MKAHFDEDRGCWVHTLGIGDIQISQNGDILTTLLGSCVSACAYDLSAGWGGMNHFMLPETECLASPRYGIQAMELMINRLLDKGATRLGLRFKVFGGANINEGLPGIGLKNCQFIEHYLRTEGFQTEAKDLGGSLARRIEFSPNTGKVLVKRLQLSSLKLRAEVEASKNLGPAPGEVEFFGQS